MDTTPKHQEDMYRRAAEDARDKEIERLREKIRLCEERHDLENERLRAALKSIAANTCCDRDISICQEAALVARKALEEEK